MFHVYLLEKGWWLKSSGTQQTLVVHFLVKSNQMVHFKNINFQIKITLLERTNSTKNVVKIQLDNVNVVISRSKENTLLYGDVDLGIKLVSKMSLCKEKLEKKN